MIVAEFRVMTAGANSSQEEPVEHFIQALDEAGLQYRVGPMGTTVEAESLDELFEAFKGAHRRAREDAPRVFAQITIDDRQDREESLESLTEGVEAGRKETVARH